MIIDINKIIYFYILICSGLLFYNVFFIFYSKIKRKKLEIYSSRWDEDINKQLIKLSKGESIEEKHKLLLTNRLTNINQLIAYSNVLTKLIDRGEQVNNYLEGVYKELQLLAYKYKRKETSDRTFFAYFIANNPPCNGKEYNSLMDILISYLSDSNMYCRENVLKALYAMGNEQSIENAFQIINSKGWFHHEKLLTDGLMCFSGDKEKLSENMWHHLLDWDQNISISVIKFITESSDQYNERFYPLLLSEDISTDLKIAIIRYYRKHIFEPVKPILIKFLDEENNINDNIRIIAAYVLEKYPGEDTVNILLNALKSSNWHIRKNAALSLINLNLENAIFNQVIIGKDQNAKDILNYLMYTKKEVDVA